LVTPFLFSLRCSNESILIVIKIINTPDSRLLAGAGVAVLMKTKEAAAEAAQEQRHKLGI
jgi:hypothetical protein